MQNVDVEGNGSECEVAGKEEEKKKEMVLYKLREVRVRLISSIAAIDSIPENPIEFAIMGEEGGGGKKRRRSKRKTMMYFRWRERRGDGSQPQRQQWHSLLPLRVRSL